MFLIFVNSFWLWNVNLTVPVNMWFIQTAKQNFKLYHLQRNKKVCKLKLNYRSLNLCKKSNKYFFF